MLFGVHRAIGKVDRLAEHIEHASERFLTDGHRDRLAEIDHAHAALHAVSGLHGDRADAVLAKVLLDFGDDVDLARLFAARLDLERVVNLWQVSGLELDVEHRSDHLNDFSDFLVHKHPVTKRERRTRRDRRAPESGFFCGLCVPSFFYKAWAPETTSIISRVIAA